MNGDPSKVGGVVVVVVGVPNVCVAKGAFCDVTAFEASEPCHRT